MIFCASRSGLGRTWLQRLLGLTCGILAAFLATPTVGAIPSADDAKNDAKNISTLSKTTQSAGLDALSAIWGLTAWLQEPFAALGLAPHPPLTPGGWLINPAGRQSMLGAGPLALVVTGNRLLVANGGYGQQSLMLIDAQSGQILQMVPGLPTTPRSVYLGLVLSLDGKQVFTSDGSNDKVRIFTLANKLSPESTIALPRGTWPAGLALSQDGRRLFVVGNLSDELLTIDLASGTVEGSAPVGHLPYGVALSRDGQRAYVTNWGSNTVTVLDTNTLELLTTVTVGMHPSALLQSPGRDELYVADTDVDTISVLDSTSSQVLRTISLAPWPGAPIGASPNALALSPDGQTLFVANAGNNDLAQIRLAGAGASNDRVEGLIPTAWFPSGVALDPTGRMLYVLNMKGTGVGPVPPGGYIADQLMGTLSRIEVPGPTQLAYYTQQVRQNNHFSVSPEQGASGAVIPQQVGDPSPIKHIIYVMKENRTYDQVLGDLEQGNGDPSLTIFGEEVTPNQHELARRFVTFDNFYCEGEVSADGWIWSTAAWANPYNQKNWPLNYNSAGRPYDFGGFGNNETAGFPGPDPLRAFIWDRLAARGISYRNYGFFLNGLTGQPPMQVLPTSIPGLAGNTDLFYSGYDLKLPDVIRLQEWLREFRQFEAQGALPTVQFVYLPRDHTVGTAPGLFSPQAMVADNDLAVGQLVQAVSQSRFWPNTAIFVIEDDAQDGPDHVDGHRTIFFAISPYTQTGKVDSTRYSTVSLLRTLELIVGVEPLTQFDALAQPLSNAFSPKPNFKPYEARIPSVSMTEVNKPDAPLAAQMKTMDFSRPDAADARVLNEAIWQSVRGKGKPMPISPSVVADDD